MIMPLRNEIGARTPTKEAIRRFLRYSTRFAANTHRQYRDTLYRFCDAMPDIIEQVTPEHLDRYIGKLKIGNNSKNTKLIAIRSLFRYLENFYDIPNVAQKVKDVPKMPSRQRVISEIEYRKLLEICKPNTCEKSILQILSNTGLRASEFASLTWQNISADEKYLTVDGKGGKRRTVPINNTARQAFHTFNFSKSYKSRNSLYRLCLSLSRRAAIPQFGPHALRHYFITELIKRGVPIAIVSRIAGHSSPVITMSVYCHLLVPDFLGATDCLD